MNKQSIIDSLHQNYHSFVDYMNDLPDEEYTYRHQEKWTAGQQLEHIVLCIKPLVQVFSMDKPAIEQTFGSTEKPGGRSYEALMAEYKEKLGEGGKAPTRFVPKAAAPEQKEVLSGKLTKMIDDLGSKIQNFSEQELDTLFIPHPLLGNLTMREMLYNTIYHVEHHHEQAKQNLKNKS